ncbi:phosphoglycerate kinase [Galdieria sulphuraria]|uniref:Phosphoglycerate kinase n=1 Tax=Galdieria sulphuraria TaxID=130081 RepID=M2X7X4_GALSU|nr:phosphoglycerate kinase [Galdieria sulphuraria]EME32655.1 phosphoglycerate kinase [Galdieria sulphuraria]|eukprot:XP_005709175.1 phosphoglycerate kinase [Galdieria sulphuraria]
MPRRSTKQLHFGELGTFPFMHLLFVTCSFRFHICSYNRWKHVSYFNGKTLVYNPTTTNKTWSSFFPPKANKFQSNILNLHMTTATSSKKKSLKDLSAADLKGKRVLVRCDLNVPLDGKSITDDTRIKASLPTIQYLINHGAKVILSSHLGRPKGGFEDRYSLAPVAERLGQLLGKSVRMAPDCIGDQVNNMVLAMNDGDIILLENVRFYTEETDNDPDFSRKLSMNMDLYVNDAFGSAHRAHASTEGVTQFIRPAVAGFLLEKELEYLQNAIQNPERPFAAIIGGSKVSSKIGVLKSLIEKCDVIIIGGGMVFTFLKARGLSVGSSLVEEDKLYLAKEIEQMAAQKKVELIFPLDLLVADKFDNHANVKTVSFSQIEEGWMGLDIGPATIEMIESALAKCKTILWNGPMGVFEMENFARGTFQVARILAKLTEQGAITIIGGGDSVAAVEKANLADKMSHISTGGGASLELIEGRVLPGVAALDDA